MTEDNEKQDDLNVVGYPNPILRQRAKPITEIDDEVRQKAQRMIEVMYREKGVGLAAPQVGWSKRLVVINVTGESGNEEIYINPEIIEKEGKLVEEEGCLSFPGVMGKVRRFEKIVVRAHDLDGNQVEIQAEGLLARAWQHEIDHLNGELVCDKLSPASKLVNSKKIKELEKEYKESQGDSS